jgi:hypothetical protein
VVDDPSKGDVVVDSSVVLVGKTPPSPPQEVKSSASVRVAMRRARMMSPLHVPLWNGPTLPRLRVGERAIPWAAAS